MGIKNKSLITVLLLFAATTISYSQSRLIELGGGNGVPTDSVTYATIARAQKMVNDSSAVQRVLFNTKLNISDTPNIRPRLTAGTNVTITGTYPALTINATGSTDSLVVKRNYTTGTAFTVANSATVGNTIIVWVTSTSTTQTITLPATPTDGQAIEIHFDNDVTTLSIVSPGGYTIKQSFTPTSVVGGETLKYRHNSSNSKMYAN